MRIYPNFVKTTQKEDSEFYRALIQATLVDLSRDQLGVLAQVKHHHFDRNRDLTNALYHSFLDVLNDLGIERPKPILTQTIQRQEAGT